MLVVSLSLAAPPPAPRGFGSFIGFLGSGSSVEAFVDWLSLSLQFQFAQPFWYLVFNFFKIITCTKLAPSIS